MLYILAAEDCIVWNYGMFWSKVKQFATKRKDELVGVTSDLKDVGQDAFTAGKKTINNFLSLPDDASYAELKRIEEEALGLNFSLRNKLERFRENNAWIRAALNRQLPRLQTPTKPTRERPASDAVVGGGLQVPTGVQTTTTTMLPRSRLPSISTSRHLSP